ncbi:hypothetical protein ACWF0M_31660 [Kribbella sp. NPDC055110]
MATRATPPPIRSKSDAARTHLTEQNPNAYVTQRRDGPAEGRTVDLRLVDEREYDELYSYSCELGELLQNVLVGDPSPTC